MVAGAEIGIPTTSLGLRVGKLGAPGISHELAFLEVNLSFGIW